MRCASTARAGGGTREPGRKPPPFGEQAGEHADPGGDRDDEHRLMAALGSGGDVRIRDREQHTNADRAEHDTGCDEQCRTAHQSRQQCADDGRRNAAHERPAHDIAIDCAARRLRARPRARPGWLRAAVTRWRRTRDSGERQQRCRERRPPTPNRPSSPPTITRRSRSRADAWSPSARRGTPRATTRPGAGSSPRQPMPRNVGPA